MKKVRFVKEKKNVYCIQTKKWLGWKTFKSVSKFDSEGLAASTTTYYKSKKAALKNYKEVENIKSKRLMFFPTVKVKSI
jgi:hypothetical protein